MQVKSAPKIKAMDARNDGFPAVEGKGTTAQAVPPCLIFGKFRRLRTISERFN